VRDCEENKLLALLRTSGTGNRKTIELLDASPILAQVDIAKVQTTGRTQ
jgi:hypothetical protein